MLQPVKRIILCFIVMALTWEVLAGFNASQASPGSVVYSIQINDVVTEGTAAYVKRALKEAENKRAEAVVITLDTPGGLVSSALEIVEVISASPVPVITYVSPRGGISASAGTLILLSGHLAAMSPGTTCGAAMPIRISGLGKYQAADEKTINFFAEHMKSLAQARNRPGDLARRFVTENLSLSNRDALEQGVIDLQAIDPGELLEKAQGKTIQTGSGSIVLDTTGAGFQIINMNVRESLMHQVSNPMVAIFLIIAGLYGLIFAFHSPGFLLPEVLGSVSLIVGLYGIGLFAVNLTAGLLIILGLGLLIAEAYTPTSGILGLGGIVSIVAGILLFPVEPLLPVSWWSSFRFMAVGVGVVGAGLLMIILSGLWRVRQLQPVHGRSEFSGRTGVVVQALEPSGLVRVQGEIWQATAREGLAISKGCRVRVLNKEGLQLLVEPLEDSEKE